MSKDECPFCIPNNILRCNILYEDDLWYITDMVDGELKHGYMMITKRHIKTPFDINEEEWAQLRDLIKKCKAMLDEYSPDGANLGWNISPVGGQNVDHAHLHLFGRFADEPLASKGLRYAFKQPSNKRGSAKKRDMRINQRKISWVVLLTIVLYPVKITLC